MSGAKYERVVLKLSGEAFTEHNTFGINSERISYFARQIKDLVSLGVEVAVEPKVSQAPPSTFIPVKVECTRIEDPSTFVLKRRN